MIRQTVLFSGHDASGTLGLWETNGTAAGTQEVAGISGADPTGIEPQYLTAFEGEVLFNGSDTGGNQGLWVTNGATAGTSELTGINGAAASLDPSNMLVFNGEVLFDGTDASGTASLWVTNGTVPGTRELTGISGASQGGVFTSTNGPDLTLFNGEVFFDGIDAENTFGLWVTNGTAAGTSEISGISGTSSSFGLEPSDLTVFDNELLFDGLDTSLANSGLWVTNGTAAGTSELTGIVGANDQVTPANGDITGGLAPTDITVFNGEALFNGVDASGTASLWVTNGTAVGTSEISGIGGASSLGLTPTDMTVLNGKVLFNGLDAADNYGLWVTNGTAAGTSELTGISGAYAGGLDPTDFAVFGSEVLFTGVDANGNHAQWVTNGTAAGTRELTGISGSDTAGGGLFSNIDPNAQAQIAAFNGEVLFQGDDAAGKDGLWVSNGTAAGTSELTGISGANLFTADGSVLGLVPTDMTVFNDEVLFAGYGG
ncbi:MAG TPA: hypothetical protein VJ226_03540, partial [Bradyrhizobium sp.]|nr:hypothetical protein [Bradyrhizobium sp.]